MRDNQSNFWSSAPPTNPLTNREVDILRNEPDQDPISDTVRTAEEDIYTNEPVYF